MTNNQITIIRFIERSQALQAEALEFLKTYGYLIILGIIAVAIVIWTGKRAITAITKARKVGLTWVYKTKADGIILGKEWSFRLISPSSKEGHCAVFGSSGSGKTSCVGIPTLQSWKKGNFFAIDISGDISRNVDGEDIIIYEPLSETTLPYDPFHIINSLETVELKDEALINLAFSLIPDNKENEVEKWFDDGGRDILKAALISYYHKGYGFAKICQQIINNNYVSFFENLDNIKNPEGLKYITQFLDMNEKSIAGCKQSADKAVEVFTSPRLKNALVDLDKECECLAPESIETHSIFLRIPDREKEQYAPLVSLVVNQMLQYLSARPEKYKKRLLIMIDEFASFKTIDISEPLQKLRKRNVRIMILLQSLAQLDRNYGVPARREMMDNFDINVVCKVTEIDSQEYFSKKGGTITSTKKTRNSQGGVSVSEVTMPAYEINDFAKLKNKLIAFVNGESFKIKKAFYFKR